MSKDLHSLVSQLGITKDRALALCSGGIILNHDFDVSPEQFLEQAEDDYESGGSPALLNSITNARRAIRCQLDKVIHCVGLASQKTTFRDKFLLLKDIGFVAPRILRKVSDNRNLLEHEYKNPSLKDVEEALDLAALFVEATNRNLVSFSSEFSLGDRDEHFEGSVCEFKNELFFRFDDEAKCFHVTACRKKGPLFESPELPVLLGRLDLFSAEDMYIDILRMAFNLEKNSDRKGKDSVSRFFEKLAKCK